MGFIRNDIATGDMFRHVYGGITKRELDERAAQLLSAWGYKRVSDTAQGAAVYEKGNRVARLLLGALVKYFKVSVMTSVSPSDEVICEVRSESSGMSGGLIGSGRSEAFSCPAKARPRGCRTAFCLTDQSGAGA